MSPAWAIPGGFPIEEPELELDVPDDDPVEELDPELDVEPEEEEVAPEPEDPLDVDPEAAPLDELVEPATPDDPPDPELVPPYGWVPSPPEFDVPHAARAATVPRTTRLRE